MPPAAQATSDFDPSYFDEDGISPTGAVRRAMSALIVGAIGLIITITILSYSPVDPTGDTAGLGDTVNNALGLTGAGLSNWLLQMLGWAALPLGFLTMFAAARAIFRPRTGITKWDTARRTGLFFASISFLSIFLAAFPIPQSWPMATGLGGWFGDSIFLGLKGIFTSMKINAGVAGGVSAFLVFCALGYAFGRFIGLVSRDVAQVLDAAGLAWAIFRVWVDKVVVFLKRRFHKSYVEPEETAGYDDRRVWTEGPGAEVAPEPAPAPKPRIIKRAAPAPVEEPAVTPAPKAAKTRKPKGHNFNFPKNGKFVLPRIDLMKTPPARVAIADAGALEKSAEELGDVLTDFGVKGDIGQVRPGPVVTLYEFEPAPGVKSSRVINLSDDIARSMAAQSARVAEVPGRNAIGIENAQSPPRNRLSPRNAGQSRL